MAGFSDGLMAGFSVMETIRDRKDARANEARRISLAEAAEARAGQAFNIGLEDRARGLAREDQLRRAGSARARVLSDPDNADEADILMLEEAGDSETLAGLENYRAKSNFASRSLRDLASQAGSAGTPGSPVTQSARAPAPFSPQENQFLAPTADSELAPNQFTEPKFVPLEDIAGFLSPDDPYLKRSGLTRGMDLSTPEARAAAASNPRRSGARVPIDPSLPSPAEIDQLPVAEQEAARAQLKTALGGRQKWFEDTRANITAGGAKPQIALNDQYSAMLDTRQDSELRQLATTQPTAWIERYRTDRLSLDENTRALVDRRAAEVAGQSLANLRQQANAVPAGADGTPDFSSPQAQALKRGIEQNIAVLSAVEANFSAAEAAGIRGGFMPVGNRELTERVTEAWQTQPAAARPATPHEERMLRTQLGRIQQQGADGGPARRISNAQIDVLGKAVGRGWIDYKDAESILLTGRVPGAALQMTQRDPKNDLYINGRLVARGYDPAAVAEVTAEAEKTWLERVDASFEGLYPDDTEEQTRRKNQYLTQMYQQRAAIQERHGFDPINADPVHTAATVNAFAATDQADNVWDKAWLGVRKWWSGPMEDQAAPYSDEILQLTRDLLPDQYGVYTLGNRQFNADSARRHLMGSGEPSDRAAVIATEGDDAALMRYVEQKIADQQEQ